MITEETLAAIVDSPASWREIWVKDLVGTNLCIEHKRFIVLAANHAYEMAQELTRRRKRDLQDALQQDALRRGEWA